MKNLPLLDSEWCPLQGSAAPLLQNVGQPAQQGAVGQAQGQPQQEQQTA